MNDTHLTIEQKAQMVITGLRRIADQGTGPMSVNARNALAQLQQSVTSDLEQITQQAGASMQQLQVEVQDGSSGAASAVYTNFENLSSNIHAAMADGATSVSQGTRLIAKALNDALKAFGAGRSR